MSKTIGVGMSGGVDSSVAAYLLKSQGYNVIGITMRLIDDDKTDKAINDSIDVCNVLGIKHYVIDFRDEFKRIVIRNFIDSYNSGITPNPCVVCNKHFKFGLFFDAAKKLGCDYISTGHYAKVLDGKLYRASVLEKDQSYFLWGIDRDVLKHIVLPLQDYMDKEQIRDIAEKAGLSVSSKKDSQEVCFVPNDDYKTYLDMNFGGEKYIGDICLEDGTALGTHTGLMHYTIGQRKGLNISYKEALYVVELDNKNNRLIVGPESSLYKNTLIAGDVNLLVDYIEGPIFAKVRSRGQLKRCNVEFLKDGRVKVVFDDDERAITLGQSVVFYDENDCCLGGGIIEAVL